MTALLVISILLTAASFYFAFMDKERHSTGKRAAAFLVFLAVTVVAAYGVRQERTAAARLAGVVEPYPRVAQLIWVPAGIVGGRYWIVQTEDSNQAVTDFYRDVARRDGWTITSDDGHRLNLRMGARCMNLIVSRTKSAGKTTIIYWLRDPC